MKTSLALIIITLFIVFSGAAPGDKTAEEINIREATFRYQFVNNASGQKQHAGAYYLSILDRDGKWSDPPKDLMKRFAGNKPFVKKLSECNAPSGKDVLDKETGESGLIFNTGESNSVQIPKQRSLEATTKPE